MNASSPVVRALVAAVLLIPPVFGQCIGGGANAALQFDGSGDWVRMANPGPGVLDGFADFTVEAWIKSTPSASYPTIVSKYDLGGVAGWFFRLTPGGGFEFIFHGQGANGQVGGGGGLDDGSWHHVACSRTGALCTLYADGQWIASALGTLSFPATAYDFALGCHSASSNPAGFWNGVLDEVRVWNVGRTQAQIGSARGHALTGLETGLAGYWRLNEATGQVVANSAAATGAALNGTLGASGAPGADDPAWSSATPPLFYCAPGAGQANSAGAWLKVNGIGDVGVPGPFSADVQSTGEFPDQVVLTWHGPPFAPLILLRGLPLQGSLLVPCTGSLDLDAANFEIVGDYYTTPFPLSLLFVLDGNGYAQTTFTVPPTLSGNLFAVIQGAVGNQPCSTVPYVLTACFRLQ